MQAWALALENRLDRPAKIVCIGDSITEGANATLRERRWIDRLLAMLRSSFPSPAPGGEGYSPVLYLQNTFPTGWDFGGNIGGDGTFGFGRRGAVLRSPDGYAQRYFTGTSIRVHFTTYAGGGRFAVLVDGAQVAVVDSASGTPTARDNGRFSHRFATPGSHLVQLRWLSGGDVFANGVHVFNGDELSGIRLIDSGQYGSTTSNWSRLTNSNAYVVGDDLALDDPSLVFVELGANDMGNGINPSVTYANLINIVDMVRENAPRASIVLVAVYTLPVQGAFPWASYVASIAAAAKDRACHLIDLSALDVTGGFLAADNVHPTDAGMALFAERIYAEVVPDYNVAPARVTSGEERRAPAPTRERGYRFLSVDARTRRLTNEYKFSDVSYTFERNQPGEFSGSISLYDKRAVDLVPQNTYIVVERGARPFWAGMLWQPTRSGKMLQIGAQGILSVFGHRNVRDTQDFDAIDRGQIIRTLVTYGQQGPGGDLGVRVGTETVGGVPMVYTANWWDKKSIASVIEDVLALHPTFSIRVDPVWLPGNVLGLDLVVDPVFPHPTPHRLEYEVNVTDYDWAPLSPSPNFIDAFGGFDNEAMLRKTSARDDLLAAAAIRIEGTIDNRDLLDEAPVEALAKAALARRSGSPAQPSVTMSGSNEPFIGELMPGSSAQVVISDGPYIQVNDQYSVAKMTVDVPNGGADLLGAETVKFEFDSRTDDSALGLGGSSA